jgi:hypothetical protein
VIARKVLIEIAYSASPEEEPSEDRFSSDSVLEDGSLGLAVCRGIVRSHGGEIRFRGRGALANFEIELPLAASDAENAPGADRKPPRALTIMLVEPDPAAQRGLLALLSARGHRGVPVAPQEAVDLAQRLHFEAVFWSLHPNSRMWTECYDALRGQAPLFVLVSDGWDAWNKTATSCCPARFRKLSWTAFWRMPTPGRGPRQPRARVNPRYFGSTPGRQPGPVLPATRY